MSAGGQTDSVAATLKELFDVRGARTLITGGASGLGLAMTEVMVDCGATVVVADIQEERLREVSTRLQGRAGSIETHAVDVGDRDQIRSLVETVTERHDGLDVAFVNAGISGSGFKLDGSAEADDTAWDRTLSVNLTGAYTTMRACGEVMAKQGRGRIIVTASSAGLRADPWVADSYVASKAALVNLTRQMALKLSGSGVNVNAIAPGTFKTNIGIVPGMERPPIEVIERRWGGTNLLNRRAEPDEIKGLALMLASAASSFITGVVYPIDAGALVNFASVDEWRT